MIFCMKRATSESKGFISMFLFFSCVFVLVLCCLLANFSYIDLCYLCMIVFYMARLVYIHYKK